jgi:hypothetical protein
MRTFAALLILFAVSAAQFEDVDQKLAVCERGCCTDAGYAWNESMGECHPGAGPARLAYTSCMNRCAQDAQRQIMARSPGSNLCFAPGFLIMAVPFAICSRKKPNPSTVRKQRAGPL